MFHCSIEHHTIEIDVTVDTLAEVNRGIYEGDCDLSVQSRAMSDEETQLYPDIYAFPAMVSGIVPIYNLPQIKSLIINRDVMMRMLLGNITVNIIHTYIHICIFI